MSQQRNYLHKNNGSSAGGGANPRPFIRQVPDQTVHQPPGAMFVIGGLGVLAGFGANVWQMITTFTAFWTMFNPKGPISNIHAIRGKIAILLGKSITVFERERYFDPTIKHLKTRFTNVPTGRAVFDPGLEQQQRQRRQCQPEPSGSV
jgi:hypothetical protein